MNPILQAMGQTVSAPQQNSNINPEYARQQVMNIVDKMNPIQKAMLRQMLPRIEKVAQGKGVDTSALSELQARI